jgi:hypothetical protein
MRTVTCVLALVLSASALASAQEDEYVNTQDGFKIYFPAPPTVKEITFTSQQNFKLPGRVYSVDRGKEHYAVTVVDYSGIEKMGIEKVKTCPPGAPLCRGTDIGGPGLWKHDVRGAIQYATGKLLERDARLTDLTWSQHDLVEGNDIQMVSNVDQSRTYAVVAMHEMKLYLVEATVPKNSPPATLFQTSLGWVDKNGKGIRYQTVYSNEFHGMRQYPPPPLVGAPGAGRGRGAGPAAQ